MSGSNEKIKCVNFNCLKSQSSSNFYVNTNPLFNTEKLPICKSCISNFIGIKNSPGYTDRVTLVLANMDKPFIQDVWHQCEDDWGKYIRQISSLVQYKGMKFSDSVFGFNKESEGYENIFSEEQLELTEVEHKKLISFWGKGLEIDDYLYLDNQYETLITSYECDSYAQEMLFQEIAHQRLTIKKNRESNKPVDKEIKTLQDLLGSSNIKPVQETGANAAEQATFGTLIKKYENEKPVPEPDPEWKDVDGIKKYIQVWFLGHLCRMLGIKNEYAQMYEDEIAKYKVEAPEYEQDEESALS